MTCKDCKPTVWCFMHNHSGEWCRDREYLVELCAVHALNERLAEALRIAHYALHNSLNCGSGCDSSVLLNEYDDAKRGKR